MKSRTLVAQASAIIDKEVPFYSNLANLTRLIMDNIPNCNWVGFYMVEKMNPEVLYLGPYQGPLACTKIPFGKGVCGKSCTIRKTIIVPNVHTFNGHIACSSETNSEIVVPIILNDEVRGVIDLDSTNFNNFDEDDQTALEKIAELVGELL